MNAQELFDDKWIEHQNGCYIWVAHTDAKGYGGLSFKGKRQRAHRAAWELHNGPIPDGLHCLHKCDNPGCVNPDHLFLGTNEDNQNDKIAKGRHRGAMGEENRHSKLTKEQVLAIRADDRTQQVIADEYGITQASVSAIKLGKTWRHV